MRYLYNLYRKEKILSKTMYKHKKPFLPGAVVEKQFIYDAPNANWVKVVGTFNDWNTSEESLMKRKKDGTWSKRIPLAPGTHQYRFLIDDVWAEDPQNSSRVDNSFGGKNSVIKI